MSIPDERLWALPKVFTYSLQNDPFLHIDGDVFLFDSLPANLLNSALVVQNVEEATDYYLQTQQELMNNFTYFPNCVTADFKSEIPIKAVNAGILGGKNIAFIKEYTNLAFEYIQKNTQHLSSINVDRFNVFFEQHLFYSLAKEKGEKIDVLINSTIKDNQYLYLGNFHETPCKRTYLHLLGHYKKDQYTCRLMASKLRELYPEYYYRVISLIKNKTNTTVSFLYNSENFSTFKTYQEFSAISKKVFDGKTNSDASLETIVNVSKPDVLNFLESLVKDLTSGDTYTKDEVENDFNVFSKNLLNVITKNIEVSNHYIYGRDLQAVIEWLN